MDGAGQDPSLAAKATHVDKPLVEEASGILSGAAAGPGKRHGELPGSLPSQFLGELPWAWRPQANNPGRVGSGEQAPGE